MQIRSLLDSQIQYYDARANEYDESLGFRLGRFWANNPDAQAMQTLQRIVRVMPRARATLELACGTGIWTRELLKSSRTVHAVDASAKMLEVNRMNLRDDDRVTYERANIFTWNPPAHCFDRVAAAFWISHVPDDLLEPFVQIIKRAGALNGEVLLIDEERSASSDVETTRHLRDGRRFPIVKVFRTAEQVERVFEQAQYRLHMRVVLSRFFAIVMRPAFE